MFIIQFDAADKEEVAAYENTFWSVFWGKGPIGQDADSYDPQTGAARQAWRVGGMTAAEAARTLQGAFNHAKTNDQQITVTAESSDKTLNDFFSDAREARAVEGVVTISKQGAAFNPDFNVTSDGVTAQLHLKRGQRLG